MKHVVIAAHPKEQSFTMSVARAYEHAAKAASHSVLLRDLYRMNFAPALMADELPWSEHWAPREDVRAERRLLADANVFVFVYPLWFNAPPAILKGYMDRVFGMGFGYQSSGGEGTTPLLTRAKMLSFSSSGAPTDWLVNSGAFEATRRLSDEHFAAVCGLTFLEHAHFGAIVPGIRPDVVAEKLDFVRGMFAKYFAG
jgi:NAD(P)H dehydrogenase (quinone)